MRLPKEMGLPSNAVAQQVRCVYGTRDAGKLWEDCYTQALEGMGFVTGISNPCTFYHPDKKISIVVHGDDFTALAGDAELDWYETELKKSFEIKIRGRLGLGCKGPQEIRILNRLVSVGEHGLTYEADPRHTDLLMASMNLTSANSSATPGIKPVDRDEFATKGDELDTSQLSPDAAIAAICRPSSCGPSKIRESSLDLENSCPGARRGGDSPGSTVCHAPAFAFSPLAFLTDDKAATYDSYSPSNGVAAALVGQPAMKENSIHRPRRGRSECEKRFPVVSPSVFPVKPANLMLPNDSWTVNNGTFIRVHERFRRNLDTPCPENCPKDPS